jgi:hypothetical protein
MPNDYPFIVRFKQGHFYQAPALRVTYKEKTRSTRRSLGGFNVIEHSGWDKTKLSIHARQGDHAQPVKSGNGTKTGSSFGVTVPATAAGVKTGVRRLRPEEAERIEEIDMNIQRLQDEIKACRGARDHWVATAWTRGHAVRLNEIVPASGENIRVVES